MSKTKLPTLAEARAALEAAEAAVGPAAEAYRAAAKAASDAQVAVNRAKRAVTEAREREAKNRIARDRRRAQALAAQYGIGIEIDRVAHDNTHYWVTGPEAVYPNDEGDPWEGDHIGGDWSEVLHRVEVYVEDLQKRSNVVALRA